MGINISIKNVPKKKLDQLKVRAKLNHRSLQGELLALIDQAIGILPPPPPGSITIEQLVENGRRLGLKTASDSVRMIREDRDR
jgi:plasmid stability protein